MLERQENNERDIRVIQSTTWLLSYALEREFPEVEYAAVATPTYWFERQTLSFENKPVKARAKYASEDFFNIFSYQLLHGHTDRVLADKASIVVSADLAIKLFGTTDDVLGKVVTYQREQLYKVSGVFENLPANSSEYFEFVLPHQNFIDKNPQVIDWRNAGPDTFVMLREGVSVEAFNKKIASLIATKSEDTHRFLFTRRYADLYLFGNYENGEQSGGRIEYVRLFSVVAVFILLIACINFMNLSTAKATGRVKEVGIKKVVGARRRTLIVQYMAESIFMTLLSVAIAILAVDLLLPQFNSITGKNLSLAFDNELLVSLMIIILVTGVVSGSYPALYLSGFSPASVLKGKANASFREVWARQGLVVFQFSLSVILIVSVIVIYNQIEFLQSKHLGYDKDNVIYFPKEGKVATSLETFLEELKNIPGVVNASSVGQSMVGGGNTTSVDWEGKDPADRTPFAFRPVGYGVLEMLDVAIVQGRSFSSEFVTDTTAVIFNEAGIEAMGMKDPIGKKIRLGPGFEFTIVGVVKNFHYESLHSRVAPMFFLLNPRYTQAIMMKLAEGEEQEALEAVGEFYKEYNPGFAFDYRYLDADYQAQYGAEKRVSVLSGYFAAIAILISCLGLFGLAAFTAERRRKEIGVRKVLGSTEMGIIYLLCGDFAKLVLLAILISLPFSYLLARQWLNDFAYKIPLEWWYFLTAGVLALAIASLTVGAQAVRASRVNPSQCLRDE